MIPSLMSVHRILIAVAETGTGRSYIMSVNYENVIDALKSALQASNTLAAYVDTIAFIESEEELKTFENYAIFLIQSDPYYSAIPRIGNTQEKTFTVDILLCVAAAKSIYNRLTQGRSKGLWEFDEDVRTVLRHNNLSKLLDNYPGNNLTDSSPFYPSEQVSGVRYQFFGRKVE